jgi:EAL domain-containing protein (putative c-di-GMP-specific phosphodiesterase class I)
VRAVVALAKGLGIPSTAEGVENADQLDSIISEGCTEMQGYLLSRPLPTQDIPAFLLSRQFERDATRRSVSAA